MAFLRCDKQRRCIVFVCLVHLNLARLKKSSDGGGMTLVCGSEQRSAAINPGFVDIDFARLKKSSDSVDVAMLSSQVQWGATYAYTLN